jgi:Subunit 17 of Mediator complex
MTESLMLPVRVATSKGREQDSLQSRIFQIYSQKGAFRHITEASLVDEITSQKQHDEDTKMAEVDESESEPEEPKDRYEMIIKSRDDMMQQLR